MHFEPYSMHCYFHIAVLTIVQELCLESDTTTSIAMGLKQHCWNAGTVVHTPTSATQPDMQVLSVKVYSIIGYFPNSTVTCRCAT